MRREKQNEENIKNEKITTTAIFVSRQNKKPIGSI
jgi:hypothetical protein